MPKHRPLNKKEIKSVVDSFNVGEVFGYNKLLNLRRFNIHEREALQRLSWLASNPEIEPLGYFELKQIYLQYLLPELAVVMYPTE